MLQILDKVESFQNKPPKRAKKLKSELGQFMTPISIATYMASLFSGRDLGGCRLLDAGAGMGALSGAFLERWSEGRRGDFRFEKIEVTAFEVDPVLREHLAATLKRYAEKLPVQAIIESNDFIKMGALLSWEQRGGFTHAILNPPYKKIGSHSSHRRLLRKVGIETVNLYTAFVALAVDLLVPGGEIVAILPRSFCNGPYYRPFRDFIFQRAAIEQIHLFGSRSKAFKDDAVLQENVIIKLKRAHSQGDVLVTHSTDETFSNMTVNSHPFNRIVAEDDNQRFIHIPTCVGLNKIESMKTIKYSLSDLGLSVSTGPVVDFRMRNFLRKMPDEETVPLLYPMHFFNGGIKWPKLDTKKANAIVNNHQTEKWLYPIGHYCVVRRFSSKEERRRIVASVVDPKMFLGISALGFENHLNVFHQEKRGISAPLAAGLAVYLNTSAVDEQFRRFNGHTQVNATDLQTMKYPSHEVLCSLGKWALKASNITSEIIDQVFGALNGQEDRSNRTSSVNSDLVRIAESSTQ